MNEEEAPKIRYSFWYFSALSFVLLSVVAMGTVFIVGVMTWGESSSFNNELAYVVYASLFLDFLVYFAFIRYGQGMHQSNIKKIVFLGILAVGPSVFVVGLYTLLYIKTMLSYGWLS